MAKGETAVLFEGGDQAAEAAAAEAAAQHAAAQAEEALGLGLGLTT